MEAYASKSPPCKALLRSRDEDFVVEEALAGLEVSHDPFPGSLPLYRVEKRSLDTFHLERAMSDALKSRVTFAGIKDKRAAAVQFLTPTSTKAMRPERIEGDRFTATLQGYVGSPIGRRHVWGNRFTIVLRDCCADVRTSVEEAYVLAAACRIPNFFGLQRFGARDPITHLIGRNIVRRRFREAVETILLHLRQQELLWRRHERRTVQGGLVHARKFGQDDVTRGVPPGRDQFMGGFELPEPEGEVVFIEYIGLYHNK